MDHQGSGRRAAANTRRQPPWPSLQGADESGGLEDTGSESTGPLPTRPPGYGVTGHGAQQVHGPGSGAHRVLGPGTGPQRLIGSGTGPQSGRTPVRGFPPGREPAGREPPGPFLGGPAQGGYSDDDTFLTGPMVRADEPYQFPAGGTGQFASPGRRRGGRTKRRFRSRAWLALAVAVVAAAGFVSYKFLYEPTVNAPVPPTLRLPTTAPGSADFDKALGRWQHIGTRAEDPQPLTVTGLYPPQFALGGSSYVRTAASITKTCSLAVYGANLQAALQSGHCTQVLRASYISGDGKMMGTVGVANLITSSAAQKAGQVTGPQEIVAPLTGKKGPTSKLGSGTGVVLAEIKGHYLILMWAEFTSLKSPSGQAQRQALEQFAANLVTGSANINLSTRMLTGKP